MTGIATQANMVQQRSVVLVIPDSDLRARLGRRLTLMRWTVLEAAGGAEAMAHLDVGAPEALIVDHWLPDLDAAEFAHHAAALCPATDLLQMDGSTSVANPRCSRRNELLHALREAQEDALPVVVRASAARVDTAIWATAPLTVPRSLPVMMPLMVPVKLPCVLAHAMPVAMEMRTHLPELVGDSVGIRELARMVRLVAPRSTSVLIEGETGTGKEIVAKAVHRLSERAGKPFVVLNCAAIPEHLLEAELFGHTRGAFTGAVASRTGRIEAAHGGTLFLDEIGEMPLALQAKLLRFLENGELQRIGDNYVSRVDVRIVAATHQPLEENASKNLFRLDLYHRLAVFPVMLPPLRERVEDIAMLVEHRLRKLGETAPRRKINADALELLMPYAWPGNVRELCHVLERATILCGDEVEIRPEHIRLRSACR